MIHFIVLVHNRIIHIIDPIAQIFDKIFWCIDGTSKKGINSLNFNINLNNNSVYKEIIDYNLYFNKFEGFKW